MHHCGCIVGANVSPRVFASQVVGNQPSSLPPFHPSLFPPITHDECERASPTRHGAAAAANQPSRFIKRQCHRRQVHALTLLSLKCTRATSALGEPIMALSIPVSSTCLALWRINTTIESKARHPVISEAPSRTRGANDGSMFPEHAGSLVAPCPVPRRDALAPRPGSSLIETPEPCNARPVACHNRLLSCH